MFSVSLDLCDAVIRTLPLVWSNACPPGFGFVSRRLFGDCPGERKERESLIRSVCKISEKRRTTAVESSAGTRLVCFERTDGSQLYGDEILGRCCDACWRNARGNEVRLWWLARIWCVLFLVTTNCLYLKNIILVYPTPGTAV